MSKFLNISTDNTLGGSSASDDTVASQKAVKDYIDAHSGGANTDLSNLTSQGKNIANWSSNVSNCITEIPQDIKLELSGTTLILKAGSKVYIPNGKTGDTLNFTEVTLSSDLTYSTWGSGSTDLMILYNNGALTGYATGMYSGATQPTTAGLWYDTTNNYMKYSSNGTSWAISNHALPLGLVGRSSGTPTAIHQVFNGIGYIGSTVFALPNVKFSSLKGRNLDGTYITHTITNTSIKTATRTSAWSNVCAYCDWNNDSNEVDALIILKDVIIVKKLPSSFQNYTVYINLEDGFTYYKGAAGVDIVRSVASAYKMATLSFGTNGTISDFNICSNVFSAINFQDSSTIAGWAMPSTRYIDLTLGASGTSYTAPANGWVVLSKVAGSDFYYCSLQVRDTSNNVIMYDFEGGYRTSPCTPKISVLKGQQFTVYYNATGATNYFRFVYAEGEN